jgi:hypothetical protein
VVLKSLVLLLLLLLSGRKAEVAIASEAVRRANATEADDWREA